MEWAVTAVTAIAAAVNVGGMGEAVERNLTVSTLGPIAEPLGQAAELVTGKIAGVAIGTAAVRCSTRSASKKGGESQGRFTVQNEPQQHRTHSK